MKQICPQSHSVKNFFIIDKMASKPAFGLRVIVWRPLPSPFNDRAFFGHKSPAARARELFKPATDSASLLVDIKNKFFLFLVSCLLGGTSQVGVFLLFFGHLYLAPN